MDRFRKAVEANGLDALVLSLAEDVVCRPRRVRTKESACITS
jgi:hypothetical protein